MTEQRSPQSEPQPGDVLRNMYGDLVKVVDVDCFGEVTFECPPGTEPRYCSHDMWALYLAACEVVHRAEGQA